MTRMITIFKDILDTGTPFYREVEFVLDRIKNGSSKELVTGIRKNKNKNERQENYHLYVLAVSFQKGQTYHLQLILVLSV